MYESKQKERLPVWYNSSNFEHNLIFKFLCWVKLEHVGVPRVEGKSFFCGQAVIQEEGSIKEIPANVSAIMSKEFDIPSDVRGTVGRIITR
jgi:hypothetical protein